MDLLTFFTEHFWATCVVLSSLTITLAGYLNNYFMPNKIWKQVIAWSIAILLTVATYFGNVITVSAPEWLSLIFTGLVVGLSANGIYDIPFIKTFVNNITSYPFLIKVDIDKEEQKQNN